MKQANKILLGALVVIGLIALAGLVYPKPTEQTAPTAGSAPAGATFSTPKIAAIAANVATVTPASLYNSSASDRVVTDVFITAQTPTTQNGTTTQYYIVAATSTNQYNLAGNTNYVYTGPGASTVAGAQISAVGNYLMSSSTLSSSIGSQNTVGLFVWPAGTYLNFVIASSTNLTASVNYVFTSQTGASTNNNGNLGSTTSAIFGVTYIQQ